MVSKQQQLDFGQQEWDLAHKKSKTKILLNENRAFSEMFQV